MKRIFFFTCLSTFIFLSAAAQSDIFMKIDEIKGESLDQRHRDAIEVISYAQESIVECITQGGGANCGKTQTGNFAFDIRFSKANLGFRKFMYEGKVLRDVEVIFRKSGANQLEYYKILLEDVSVVRLTESISDQDGATQIELKAIKATWTYTPQNPNGSGGTPTTFKWNFATNSPN